MLNRLQTLAAGVAAFVAIFGSAARAADEKLLISIPKGYKVGFQDRNSRRLMTEFVPQNETVENWSQMITVQVFYRSTNIPPVDFEKQMVLVMKKTCPKTQAAHVTSGAENGYPFSLWIEQFCPDQTTGKPETTHFKAIQGKDTLYVVQKAFKAELTKERSLDATLFLRSVRVCDLSSASSPCPGSTQPRTSTAAPI